MARESRLSSKAVAIWLALFFLLALGLRVGLNVDASFDDDSQRYVYSGNDPYYHDRVLREITSTGESVVFDEALKYPSGNFNPNPPMYDWTSAMVAGVYDSMGVQDPEGAALNSMVAVWGALTIFPVYVLAAALWNRQAGLWAAFLMAVSAPSIQRGVWGFADHDATTMFWITLTLMAMVKGLKVLDQREYVKDWRHGDALVSGIRNSFYHNRTAMLWSTFAGVALSAAALTWKGYPYVLAVLAVALGFQLLWDHVKNRDSTALWAFYLLPMIMVALIPLPYYSIYHVFLDTTIWAGIYVLIGAIIVGAILVPTRDLPSILVFPALAIAAVLGLVVMLLVFPDVGRTVFTGLGYFQQTKLFTTIAEAQRSELGRVAASFGFFTFILAFWGFGRSAKKAWRGDNAHMLMAAWAIVAVFMAFAASRFIMNAAPVFAVLSAGVIVTLVSMVKFDEVRRRFRQQHGQNRAGAALKSLNGRAVAGALLLAFFLVLPNAWLGVDAAIPREEKPDNDRFGAFGIDFDVKTNGWGEVFSYLREQDTEITPMQDRPAFIAWWDYGHWATDLGHHPTVADPFQNQYQLAGRFLASESEQEATGWLLILLADHDYKRAPAGEYTPAVRDALNDVNASLLDIGPVGGRDNEMDILRGAIDMEGDDVFGLYEAVMDASGKRIEYFGVDIRMYPVSVDQPGIFYAPSFLANKNPDEFIPTTYSGSGLTLRSERYGIDENGDSFAFKEPRVVDTDGNRYTLQQIGGANYQAFPANAPISENTQGTQVQAQVQPTPSFFDSMYARAFGHGQNGFTPGEGLNHWRVVSEGGGGAVKLLQYYSGATVTGTVVDDGGAPIEGVDVAFVDGFGASHGGAATDASGDFQVRAPFSQFADNGTGDLRLVVRSGGAEVFSSSDTQITKEQARAGDSIDVGTITVARGAVAGNVFEDLDGNGTFEAGEGLEGAVVTVGGQNTTAGADGSYAIDGVQPGQHTVQVEMDGYSAGSASVDVESGETAEADVELTPQQSEATLVMRDQDGEQLPAGIRIDITGPTDAQPSTNSTGQATVQLLPGDYQLSVDFQDTQGGQERSFTADETFSVPFGGEPLVVEITVQRS